MSKITTLFIDKGGVLVNNDELGAQCQRLIAEWAFDQIEPLLQ